MAYRKYGRKKTFTKKSYARKRGTFAQKVAKIAKSTALRQQETKHHVFNGGSFVMAHNISRRFSDNVLRTAHGFGDGNGGRIGDQITLRGVKMYFGFLQKFDRPNVTFKIWVLKGRAGLIKTLFAPLKNVTGVNVMDPVDTEKCKVLATRTYKFLGKNASMHDSTTLHNKELMNFRSLWIPFRNSKYTYWGDNQFDGKDYNIEVFATAYDTNGTLNTDVIGEITYSHELFYKDG